MNWLTNLAQRRAVRQFFAGTATWPGLRSRAACVRIVLCGLLLTIGCQTRPSRQIAAGDVLLEDDFSHPYGWDNRAQDSVEIGVRDGVYEMRSDVTQYVRGFNTEIHGDAIIQVETRQLSVHEQNAYGIICRGSPGSRANGYYFLIAGNGFYSIRRGQDNSIEALVDWAYSGAINRGIGRNVVRAICAGDYFALHVNDQFVAEASDSSFKTGYTGFVVATSQGGDVDILFDDLVILEARATP